MTPEEAQQLLDSKAFQESIDSLERHHIRRLREIKLNGSPESIAEVMEITRQLQSSGTIKRNLEAVVANGRLKDHNDHVKSLRNS